MIPEFDFGSRIGGLYPSQARCFNASAALTLFDLRVPAEGDETRGARRLPTTAPIAEDAAVALRVPLGGLAERFLTKAFGKLGDVLKEECDVQLGVWIEDGVMKGRLLNNATKADVTEAEARGFIAKLEPIASPEGDEYKWTEMVENIVAECKKFLTSMRVVGEGEADPADGEWEEGVRRNFDKARVEKIKAEGIVPCGLPMMEVGFSAGGEQIIYPNPWGFSDEHWELWGACSPYAQTRGRLDYVYSAALWLPHEVLHCIQDGAMGTAGAGSGTAAENWQCEYTVCFGQMLFLASVIGEHRKKGAQRTLMLPSHIIEEVLLWYEACLAARDGENPGAAWSAGCGKDAPSTTQPYEVMEDDHAGYLATLGRVVLDKWGAIQNYVEVDDQVTSYFAEFVKYTNRVLRTTAADKLPEVVASLVTVP